MNKLKRKAVYEAPLTERFSVEMEGGFMAGSVELENSEKTSVEIVEQDKGSELYFNSSWD